MKCYFNVSAKDFVKLKLLDFIESQEFWKILQEIVQFAIDLKFADFIHATPYERTNQRTNYRNGYREKTLITSVGNFTIKIPKCRRGSFFPEFLNRYQHIVDALICVIQETYLHGVSTRNIQEIYKGLISDGLSKSTISQMNQKLLDLISEFRNRQLCSEYRYIWLDGKFTKKIYNNRKHSVVILHAIGVTLEGKRESLGFSLSESESESSWRSFLKSLQRRGLENCQLWIRDEHKGLINALSEVFPGQTQQRCIVHWMRNIIDQVQLENQPLIKLRLKEVNQSLSKSGFLDAIKRLESDLEKANYIDLAESVRMTLYDITNYLDFPFSHWSKIKCTNQIERLNEELERRFKTIPIFPNDRSIEILGGSILMDFTEKWSTEKNFINVNDSDSNSNLS